MTYLNGISLLGMLVFLALAWALSANRKVVNWRLVGGGTGLQLLFGLFVFRSESGRALFAAINAGVNRVIEAAASGGEFVFGPLALPPGTDKPGVGASIGFVLATQAFPLVIVFSALVGVLYYAGVMQRLIRAFAYIFTRLFGISGAESLCAASNIFVGVESSLTVRPFLWRMTRSELCTVLTAGMATVASNIIGVYYFLLKDTFPGITGHLVSASILSAPAALVMAKLLVPETEEPETRGQRVTPHVERADGLFVAIIDAANNGVRLIVGIAALLIAVVGLLAIFNLVLGEASVLCGAEAPVTLQGLLGYVFYPFALLMGVPGDEALRVGEVVGQRLILTELASYGALDAALADPVAPLSPRSTVIAAYALCGFAHIPSMAIFVGGVAALVPERKADLTAVAPRALVAANLACLMTGCVAGAVATGQTLLGGG